jgi:hypothetical protein
MGRMQGAKDPQPTIDGVFTTTDYVDSGWNIGVSTAQGMAQR